MSDSLPFEWTPLTEDERIRNAGWGQLIDQAAAGDAIAALALERLRTAYRAMQPVIDAAKAEIEREWFDGPGASGGLARL